MKIRKIDLFEFKKLVDEDAPFVVKFKSEGCHLCVDLQPEYESVAEKYHPIPFYDVDVDEEEELSDLFIEEGVPTIFYIKGKTFNELQYPENGYDKKSLIKLLKKQIVGSNGK